MGRQGIWIPNCTQVIGNSTFVVPDTEFNDPFFIQGWVAGGEMPTEEVEAVVEEVIPEIIAHDKILSKVRDRIKLTGKGLKIA